MIVLQRMAALNKALTRHGHPPISPWFLATLTRFYKSGKRVLVFRVGRRGGKSRTLCFIAIVEAYSGHHVIPPGDRGVIAFISVSRDESASRLRTIEEFLRTLNIGFKRVDDTIELLDRPIVFKIFSASISGVSGFTTICIIADELAKWPDDPVGVNPASEVLASLRPTMATMPHAKMFLSSSPFSIIDAHAQAFSLGDTPTQMVAHAESWIANPSLTEAACRELEPNERRFQREYMAIPVESINGAFEGEAIERAFAPRERPLPAGERVMIIDASSGKKDVFAFGICAWCSNASLKYLRREDGDFLKRPWGEFIIDPNWRPEPPYLQFERIDGFDAEAAKKLTGAEIVQQIAWIARSKGIRDVHGDQREALMLASEFRRNGLQFHEHPWSGTTKPQAVEHVRRWLADGQLLLPEHKKLRSELYAFQERITSSGQFTFSGARGHGDDYVALLLTAALADLASQLQQSPMKPELPRGVGQQPLFAF